jgi:hypothetical protein
MTTVYLVTRGSYSDYGIAAVYTLEADAQRHVELLNRQSEHHSARVETYELYPPGDTRVQLRDDWEARVTVNPDGTLSGDSDDVYHHVEVAEPVDTTVGVHNWGRTDRHVVIATAATKEAAVKAARERAAQLAVEIIEGRA